MESLNILFDLQNILTFKNINFLKENFIAKHYDIEDSSQKVDYEKGIIEYYDSVKGEVVTLDFNDELNKLLWNETKRIKSKLDIFYIQSDYKNEKQFLDYIKKTFKYIDENIKQLVDIHPVCFYPKNEIYKYLYNKYNIEIEHKSISNKNSLFKFKSDYSINILKKLYIATIENDIIYSDSITEKMFIEIFTENETDLKLTFNCSTPLLVNYLEKISVLFNNFNGKSIEVSKRFITKNGKFLTQSNFNKSKKSLSVDDKLVFDEFVNEFDELL